MFNPPHVYIEKPKVIRIVDKDQCSIVVYIRKVNELEIALPKSVKGNGYRRKREETSHHINKLEAET